jgi:macrolide transport system ATP-binding/permease protein
MLREFLRRLQFYLHRNRFEADLDEEMRHHLSMKEHDSGSAGTANRQFGNVTLLKEESRAMWAWIFWEQLLQDLRYAIRAAIHNRAFTALAVLSLALGIGANTAIYSFMDALLLRSLPVSDPGSLAVLNWHARMGKKQGSLMYAMSGSTYDDSHGGGTAGIFPYQAFEVLRKNDSAFSVLFAFCPARELNVMSKGQADLTRGEYVSGDYFRGLGVSPAAGRLILPDDDRAGAFPVAVISYSFSQKRFGETANAIGQQVLVNNLPFTVAGVAPPEFFGVDPGASPDIYLPMHANLLLQTGRFGAAELYADQHYYAFEMMGRLRPGVSLAQAQAALTPPFHQWVESTAQNDRERANLPQLALQQGAAGIDRLRRKYSQPLYVLMTMVALILAIACANVANLLLARAAARRREIALRLSVGADRFRVVRQLLTESVVLSSLGGALGVAFAIWGIRFLSLLLSSGETTFPLHVDLNWHVLAVAVGLSLLTGVLFGLAPALQSTRVDVGPALKETRTGQLHSRHSFRRFNLGHTFVVVQIAVSLLILVAAGLFVRTLSNLQSIELGFNRENVLLFKLNATKAGHHGPETAAFYNSLRQQFSAIPGVRDASLSDSPMVGAGSGFPVAVAGQKPDNANRIMAVGAEYFKTMQIPILMGRELEERDRLGSPLVAVVSEHFVRINFGDRNPVGQHLTFQPVEVPFDVEIVGVARNAHYGDLQTEPPPVIYFPFDQIPLRHSDNGMVFALRTAGNPLRYVNSVREIVRQADSRVPVTGVKTQVAQINEGISQEIMFAELCTAFAVVALLIACVGLYGTVSYNVARRTSEIGIRVALGAQRDGILWMVLREVMILAAIGLAISVPAALAASKLIASFLFDMKPNDPWALTVAALTLLASAILAGYLPAWKASRIDPTTALRHE